MADDFDLDDMLNDVLNSTIPETSNNLLDDLADELLGPTAPESKEIKLKYSELMYLPLELRTEWETTIAQDEVVMKERKAKKLSNAYNSVDSCMNDLTIQKFFTLLLNSVLGEREYGQEMVQKMSQDEKLVSLFKDELKDKTRICINTSDTDLIHGTFPHIKSVMNM